MHKQVSDRKVAANQSNARQSTAPKTVAANARASLNSFKHGAYANLDTRHRELPKPECAIDEQSGHISENKGSAEGGDRRKNGPRGTNEPTK